MSDINKNPVFIAVAPNGARHQKRDHAGVPISPRELADTALSCAEAGAAMLHLHVRDESGRHSLQPAHYEPAIREVRQAVGSAMMIQVTSEAAGIYSADEQMRLISTLMPDGVSLALREIVPHAASLDAAAKFLESLAQHGTMMQYILYDADEVRRYRQLVADGVIPDSPHFVLFVLGRYSDAEATAADIDKYVAEHDETVPWMVCAFGRQAFDILGDAAGRGGHIRIGFENGWQLPDGSIADDNAILVRTIADRVRDSGRPVASVADARRLLKP